MRCSGLYLCAILIEHIFHFAYVKLGLISSSIWERHWIHRRAHIDAILHNCRNVQVVLDYIG